MRVITEVSDSSWARAAPTSMDWGYSCVLVSLQPPFSVGLFLEIGRPPQLGLAFPSLSAQVRTWHGEKPSGPNELNPSFPRLRAN